MGVPWIKINTNIFDDEKIKIIDGLPDHDAILVIWIKLLTLAGKSNSGGCLLISDSIPYTDEMLSAVFNRPLNTVRLALETFVSLEMIEKHDSIKLVNWEKHQNGLALEVIRANDRKRKQLQREKKQCPGHVLEKSRKVRILELELDKEIDKEFKKENTSASPSASQEKETRKIYGSEKNVLLSDSQYASLLEDFGEMKLKACIDELSNAKAMKGYKYKRDDLAIRKWVVRAIDERGSHERSSEPKQNRGDMPTHPFTPAFEKH
jgi:predicted phage replisome organizer